MSQNPFTRMRARSVDGARDTFGHALISSRNRMTMMEGSGTITRRRARIKAAGTGKGRLVMEAKAGMVLTNGHVTVSIKYIRPHYGAVCQLLTAKGGPAKRGKWVSRTWYGREIYIPMSHIGRHWKEKES